MLTHGTYDPDDDSTKTPERGYGTPPAELVPGHHLVPLPDNLEAAMAQGFTEDPEDYAYACSCGRWGEDVFDFESHLIRALGGEG